VKVSIIGFGVVGRAQAYLMHALGHEVYVYDVSKIADPPDYVKIVKSPYSDPDLTFICVPEDAVEETVEMLIEKDNNDFFVIKSTVPPTTTRRLMEKYGIHICHNPEFLREAHSLKDAVTPSRIVIGECCPKHGLLLKTVYAPLGVKTYVTDPTTSELIKLAINSLRAVIITYWNEIYELAEELGVKTEDVVKIVDQGRTIDSYEGGNWGTRFFGKPFGGKCLPKDLTQLIKAFRDHSLNPRLFEAVREYNRILKVREREK